MITLKVLFSTWVTTTPLFFNTLLEMWHSVVVGVVCAFIYSYARGREVK